MKNKKLSIKNKQEYDIIECSTFDDKKREKFIRKLVKLASEYGWRYSQSEKAGKTFCVIGNSTHYPNGKDITYESAEIRFSWKSRKHKEK